MTPPDFTTPQQIAEAGHEIYDRLFRDKLEATHNGEFVVIDVVNERHFVGRNPLMVLELARRENPSGVFHLIRIGSAGAFRVSFTFNGRDNPRVLQRGHSVFQA